MLCWTLAGHGALQPSTARASLLRAAEQADQARQQWLHLARQLQMITTDTRGHVSPSGIADAVAAAHSTSEAIASLGQAVIEQTLTADRADRILLRTRSMPERHGVVPRPFGVTPAHVADSLIERGHEVSRTVNAAAGTLASVAVTVRAPPRVLSAARTAAGDRPASLSVDSSSAERLGAESGQHHELGRIEAALKGRGVNEPQFLWRAAALDEAARKLLTEAAAGGSHGSHAGRRLTKDREAGH